MVDVTKIVCINDMGHLFNPEGAAAQRYGGAIMGLGRSATKEIMTIDEVNKARRLCQNNQLWTWPPDP